MEWNSCLRKNSQRFCLLLSNRNPPRGISREYATLTRMSVLILVYSMVTLLPSTTFPEQCEQSSSERVITVRRSFLC